MRKMLMLLALSSALVFAQQYYFTDPRDGKKYNAVKIGEQIWMAENLNYNASGSKCYGEGGKVCASYDYDGYGCNNYVTLSNSKVQANCSQYGRLYNWATATIVCPAGWHLPSNNEWGELYNYLNGWTNKLKTNGFAALPSGVSFFGNFYGAGLYANWWSASEYNTSDAHYMEINHNNDNDLSHNAKSDLRSVRCLKDEEKNEYPSSTPYSESYNNYNSANESYNRSYEQTRSTTSVSKSYEPMSVVDFPVEIGLQSIWDMIHFRFSFTYIYMTFGAHNNGDSLELLFGGIYRWFASSSDLTTGFGLFGGLGTRIGDYEDCNNNYCSTYTEMDPRHELGAEVILGYFSLYVAERNFHRIGGGVGVIF